jgi:methionine-rich copper-binding protein CopC
MKRLRLIVVGLASVLALIQAAPSTVLGHAFPIRSDPRVGWTVPTSPAKVTIWFDGELEPAFSAIAVYNVARQRIDKENSRVDAADPSVLEVDVPPLAPGTYRVHWKVLAKDTHVTEGDFYFTIAGKTP